MSATIPTPANVTEAEEAVLEAAMELCRELTFTRRRVLDSLSETIRPYSQSEPTRGLWLAFEKAVTALDYQWNPEHYCQTCLGKGEAMRKVRACCGSNTATRECACGGADYEELDLCPDCEGNAYVGRR